MLDPGLVGSPADLATLGVVLYSVRHEIQPRIETLAAGVVALAEQEQTVDDDTLQDELEVSPEAVEALRPVIVCGGSEDGENGS
ncbi:MULTISPECIES: hypothetical protein [Salinibaculum]|uniref:hypothetical protein n=1 Tax=Salinibaculum TaxID=2732368 RepID=UPI0030D134B6